MIPRDLVCYYCQRGTHARCALPKTCACRQCYPCKVAFAHGVVRGQCTRPIGHAGPHQGPVTSQERG